MNQTAPPAKPDTGAPCNGCGICCMAEPCPVGMIRYLRTRGPCPALLWRDAENRYVCGMLARAYNRPLLRRLLARWIAAGIGCDSAT